MQTEVLFIHLANAGIQQRDLGTLVASCLRILLIIPILYSTPAWKTGVRRRHEFGLSASD